MQEIAPALISMTLVVCAVFIPVSFISGTSGIFFKQFGLTMAVAIALSAINALTLSPALCALFLKPHPAEGSKKNLSERFFKGYNTAFETTRSNYQSVVAWLGRKKNRWIVLALIAVFSTLMITLIRTLPSGFVPAEDTGLIMGTITLRWTNF